MLECRNKKLKGEIQDPFKKQVTEQLAIGNLYKRAGEDFEKNFRKNEEER